MTINPTIIVFQESETDDLVCEINALVHVRSREAYENYPRLMELRHQLLKERD